MNDLRFLWLFHPAIQPKAYLEMCQKLGMNWVVANPHILKNPQFAPAVREQGYPMGLNFPVFSNEEYLKQHPQSYGVSSKGAKTQRDWLHFACPTDPSFMEHQKQELAQWLERIKPELVSLDFIRHYMFWERVPLDCSAADMEEGCYCPRCMDKLANEQGDHLRDLSPHQLKTHHMEELSTFRRKIVTETVKDLTGFIKDIKPDVTLMLKLIPWLEEEHGGARTHLAGQDLTELKDYIDLFGIMSFLHIRQEKPEKMIQLAKMVKEKTGKEVLLTLQGRSLYGEPELKEERFLEYWNAIKSAEVLGYNLFDYNCFSEDEERFKLIKYLIETSG